MLTLQGPNITEVTCTAVSVWSDAVAWVSPALRCSKFISITLFPAACGPSQVPSAQVAHENKSGLGERTACGTHMSATLVPRLKVSVTCLPLQAALQRWTQSSKTQLPFQAKDTQTTRGAYHFLPFSSKGVASLEL